MQRRKFSDDEKWILNENSGSNEVNQHRLLGSFRKHNYENSSRVNATSRNHLVVDRKVELGEVEGKYFPILRAHSKPERIILN